MKCTREECSNEITGYGKKYCSRSCSAIVTNKTRPSKVKGACKICDSPIRASLNYCSDECRYGRVDANGKMCPICNIWKPWKNFHKSSERRDGHQHRCKSCNINKVSEWQDKNSGQYKSYVKKRSKDKARQFAKRAKKYGLTIEELQILIDSANNQCTICKRPPINWLVVDHCHTTNRVRGMLCEKCNQAIGLLDDNIEYLQGAIEYLSRPE